ncbi:MAG: hypothetical protein ACREUV_00925 [Burkholderiales bacterium]
MTISHADFLRTLPAALNGLSHRINGNEITVLDGKRELKIFLAPETQRHFGPIPLPVTNVVLIFNGFTEEKRERFLARYDLAFRRGGG